MPKFFYKAKRTPGQAVEGEIESDNEAIASNKLIASGYFPVWIKEETSQNQEIFTLSTHINSRDIAIFTRQLSDLLDAGLSLYNALNVILSQTEKPALKLVIQRVSGQIKDGATFSESLRVYPRIFSNLYINLVKSGEVGGMLGQVLSNIANFLEKEEETRDKVFSALAYPALMASVGILTIFVLLTFVVPKLVGMFQEMEVLLPLPTQILINLSNFLRRHSFLILALFFLLYLFIRRGQRNEGLKQPIDQLKLKIPILGRLIKQAETARFARTLSTLLRNGVPILYSLEVVSGTVGNIIFRNEISKVCQNVKEGSSFANGLRQSPYFSNFVINMVAVGEEGGFLEKALVKVADNYEAQADRTVKIITSLIEPVLILVMGLVVGFIVISMLLPVFQLSLAAH